MKCSKLMLQREIIDICFKDGTYLEHISQRKDVEFIYV
jgi:hypothetical protein